MHKAAWAACLLGVSSLMSSAQAESLPRWELGVGTAGISMQQYRGSDQSINYVLPFPLVVYRLDWLKADRNGVRAKVLESERAEVNLSVSAGPPVRSKNNQAREGMPDIKPMLEVGPSLDVNLWKASEKGSSLRLLMPIRGAFTVQTAPKWEGWIFQPRLNLDVPKVIGEWNAGFLVGPMFATQRQHAYIYNVDAAYATSTRPAYTAKSGYSGTQVLLSLSRKYESVWFGAYARYDNLRGTAFVDSPLVKRRDYYSAGFAITWTFARSSEMVESAD